jgi:acetolactate synthase-1/2/3 large subunit
MSFVFRRRASFALACNIACSREGGCMASNVPKQSETPLSGADVILASCASVGVKTWFTNPGTSEIYFVAGILKDSKIRAVLCLFEGVATGAADGYGRMAGTPAAALLHLGPGLANGLANLHNARRARTPLLNIVGDHAIGHQALDAPLESDIRALASTVSGWVRRVERVDAVSRDALEAVAWAGNGDDGTGSVSTLIVPSDVSWSSAVISDGKSIQRPPAWGAGKVEEVARAIRKFGPHTLLIVGGACLLKGGRKAAYRLAAATGTRVLAENAPARQERGRGLPELERIAYRSDSARRQIGQPEFIVLAGAQRPVSFFAYPGEESDLVPESCLLCDLGSSPAALERLADDLAPTHRAQIVGGQSLGLPTGLLSAEKIAVVVGVLLPENAIVSDEAVTSGQWLPAATADSPPHDWLALTGGAIGQGIPVAIGAAMACPDRPVLNLQADGSALYTIQGLWTQARERLDITTVIYSNSAYSILEVELRRATSTAPGASSSNLLGLPGLDFVSVAEGFGVPAVRVHTVEEFVTALRQAFREPGPHLIEAKLPTKR